MPPTKRITKAPSDEGLALTLDDPRLDVLRPDPKLVDQYVSRTMKNGESDLTYLTKCWERRENVLLVGDTQGGKTMVVNVMACVIGERMGLGKPVPVFTLSGSNGITDFDLFGQPTAYTDPVTSVESLVHLPGTVDMAARVGGILYVDEISMIPERVTSSLHPATDWRRSFTNRTKAVKIPGDGFMPEIVKLSDDLWIVGTMNPAGYRGSGNLNEAFANRFRWLEWGYTDEVENTLIPNDAVRVLGGLLRAQRDLGHIRTPLGTAALMRVARDVEEDGVEMAIYSLLSMFPANERDKVNEIIDSKSFRNLLVRGLPTGVEEGWPDGSESPF